MPVANRPILFHAISSVRDAGIDDIGIIVGDTQDEIRAAVGDGSNFGVKITYVHQDEPLGLAHAVLTAEEYIDSSPFVMYLGDNLIRDGIASLADEFRAQRPNCQIMLARVSNPSQFGVAELDSQENVVRLVEKPAEPRSDYALVGVYMFDATIFDAARAIRPSARGELEITDAIQHLIDTQKDVRSHIIRGWWKDTGKLGDMLEANRILLSDLEPQHHGTLDADCRVEGSVAIGKGTVVERSTLRGPLVIGEECVVRDAYIGPFTSIDDGVTVERAELEHSIVLRNSVITDIPIRIESSLIGRDVTIRRAAERPRAQRFMVGDSSLIEV